MILHFCDFAIVTEDAELGFIEERIGTVGSANPFVPSLILTIGLKRARNLMFTGRRFSGKEAADMVLTDDNFGFGKRMEDLCDEILKRGFF
jgi:enoyl-CoA hydratase/carnithine racemase